MDLHIKRILNIIFKKNILSPSLYIYIKTLSHLMWSARTHTHNYIILFLYALNVFYWRQQQQVIESAFMLSITRIIISFYFGGVYYTRKHASGNRVP
jgi:hypothetical protein